MIKLHPAFCDYCSTIEGESELSRNKQGTTVHQVTILYHIHNTCAPSHVYLHNSPTYSKWCKEQPVGTVLAWATDHHQEAYMSAKGILWRVMVLQTPVVEPPLVSMAPTWEPESRKQMPQQATSYNIIELYIHVPP